MIQKHDGYRGIWYFNQPSNDEYVYKYSGGLGTYCEEHIPFAHYAPAVNRTFFCYGGTAPDENRLVHMVSFFDHATGRVPRPVCLMDKQTSDAHDNPVIMLDDEGHVFIFSSAHGTARPAYIHRSRRPYDIEDFELISEWNFSYPQPWWLAGQGFCFLHTRYVNRQRTLNVVTSGDGRTWSEPTLLAHIEMGHYQVSWRCGRRVGTCFNFHPSPGGLNYRTNLYYMETPDFGRTWTTAGGTPLKLPLLEVANPALVCDFRSQGRLVYMKDMTFDAAGRPVLLVVTSNGYASGPANGPRIWQTARWTGSEWDIRGQITSDSNYDAGSLYIEADGTWRLIAPTESGPQPFNPGGEMAVWTSRDQGATWNRQAQITAGSEYNHTYSRRPVNAHDDFYAFWADGHARRPSESRLYFCNKAGQVRRLPVRMTGDWAEPEAL